MSGPRSEKTVLNQTFSLGKLIAIRATTKVPTIDVPFPEEFPGEASRPENFVRLRFIS